MNYLRFLLCSVMLMMSLSTSAQEWLTFGSELNETRYHSLITELRCPKCQNQNLADSSSGISVDLRRQVHSMVESGRSDQEIVDYMVARYGEFVLYRPQKTAGTFLLWYGPFMLLGFGIVVFFLVVIRNQKKRKATL